MDAETHLLLVRHPETTANVDGRFIGRGDAPYTLHGQRQATEAAALIAAFRPDAVWSSPLHRALTLARMAGELTDLEPILDSRVIEIDFGEAEGLTFEEVSAAGIHLDYASPTRPVAPRGESRAAVQARVASFMQELTARGGRHAVVTHGGPFRAAMVHALGLSSEDIWAFHVRNAQLAHICITEGHGTLEEFSAV